MRTGERSARTKERSALTTDRLRTPRVPVAFTVVPVKCQLCTQCATLLDTQGRRGGSAHDDHGSPDQRSCRAGDCDDAPDLGMAHPERQGVHTADEPTPAYPSMTRTARARKPPGTPRNTAETPPGDLSGSERSAPGAPGRIGGCEHAQERTGTAGACWSSDNDKEEGGALCRIITRTISLTSAAARGAS
jgi:hypothetical protein